LKAIEKGDRGLAVSDVQKKLHELGFSPPGFEAESREGFFGECTEQAVREFQAQRGLRADGRVDETTWHELVEASFRLGDRFLYLRVPPFRGDDVRELQEYLNRLGFNAGREDGIFGQETDRALRAFQHDMGLPVDGIAGSSTISCLLRLRHALKETSVAEVHESLLDSSRKGPRGRSVVLGATGGDEETEEVLRGVLDLLSSSGLVPLLAGGPSAPMDESRCAQLANQVGADVVLGMRKGDEPGVRIFFFGGKSYSSPRGRRLAELLQKEIAEATGMEVPSPEGRSFPLLRETRMPCVMVEWLTQEKAPARLAEAIAQALTGYFSPSAE